jgi:hypothetical protein
MTITPPKAPRINAGIAAAVTAGVVGVGIAVLTAHSLVTQATASPDAPVAAASASRTPAAEAPHTPAPTPTAAQTPAATPEPTPVATPVQTTEQTGAGGAGSTAESAVNSSTDFTPSQLFATGPLVTRVDGHAADPSSHHFVAPMTSMDFVVSLRRWTVPVYVADASDPRTTVDLTTNWIHGAGSLKDVPLPAEAQPDPEADAHVSIVDPDRGCVYDLFGATRTGDSMTARLANATPIDSTGTYVDGLGSRASGFSAAAGLIWPEEIEAGVIDHALIFAYPHTRAGAFVTPATKTDGTTTTSSALPMGARVRLDPSLDLSSLGLNRTERIIATALQRYGMVLADTSGGFTLYAAHGSALPSDPYAQLFGTTSDWASLARIPTERLQVVALPPLQTTQKAPSPTSCAQFSR